MIVVAGDPSTDLSVLSDPDNITHVVLDGVLQEFEDDLREQRFHNNYLPNQYSWATVTHALVDSGGHDVAGPVSWTPEQQADTVADEVRLEREAATEATALHDDLHL